MHYMLLKEGICRNACTNVYQDTGAVQIIYLLAYLRKTQYTRLHHRK